MSPVEIRAEAERQVQAVILPLLQLSPAQRIIAEDKLVQWAIERAAPGDPRLSGLLVGIRRMVKNLAVTFSSAGFKIVVAPQDRATMLILDRGAIWFRGGDWQLACVSTFEF